MANANDNFFDGFDDEQVSEKIPDLMPGNYRLKVESIRAGVGKISKKNYVRATVKVIESSGEEANPPGSLVSFGFVRGQFASYYVRDVKSLGAALLGQDINSVSADLLAELVAEDQPAKGTEFRAFVSSVPGKKHKNGTPVRNFLFRSIEEDAEGAEA